MRLIGIHGPLDIIFALNPRLCIKIIDCGTTVKMTFVRHRSAPAHEIEGVAKVDQEGVQIVAETPIIRALAPFRDGIADHQNAGFRGMREHAEEQGCV